MNIWIIFATYSGIIIEIVVLSLVLFWVERRVSRRMALTIAAFCVFRLIGEFLKNGLGFPRPCWSPGTSTLIPCPNTFSFPSGHALGSAMVGTISGLILGRRWVWAVALLLAVIISASRVAVGVHTIGDVTGGMILGTIFGYIAWRVYWHDR